MEKIGKQIAAISQAANLLATRRTKVEGFGTAEYELVQYVKENPGVTQKLAGEHLGMDKGAVARRVVNLEQKGYLLRKANPKDARSQLLFPTKKAMERNQGENSAEEVFYAWLLDELSEKKQRELCKILDKLSERVAKGSENGFSEVCQRLGVEEGPVKRERPETERKKRTKRKEQPTEKPIEEPMEKAEKRRRKEPEVWLL